MSVQKRIVGAVVAVASITLGAADAPYFGRWKLNAAKTDLGPTQVAFSRVGTDRWQQTEDGKSYKFTMDGKFYPDAYGGMVAWKQLDASSWLATRQLNGKTVAVVSYKLSADGKTLTDTTKLHGADPPVEVAAVLRRTGGGPDLVGTWTGTPTISSFMLEVIPQDGDGLIFRVPDAFETKARFDGKPYPVTGAHAPSGQTAAVTRTGPLSFAIKFTEADGTVSAAMVTVSSDGKTLTEVLQAGAIKRTWVFDRQP